MKNFIVILAFALSVKLAALGQVQPIGRNINPGLSEMLTNPPPSGFATRLDYLRSFTNKTDIFGAYHHGQLTKGEGMIALEFLGDKDPMDFYGKVIDQNGQPIVGVEVKGYVGLGALGYEGHDTLTDSNGQFKLVGLHGKGLGIFREKEGYDFGMKAPYQRPGNYVPNPNDPIVLNMWKLRGAEPMIFTSLQGSMPGDGEPKILDLNIGHGITNCELKITLNRFPFKKIAAGSTDGWTVKIETKGWDLLPECDHFPNWAPESGYKSRFEEGVTSNSITWNSEFHQSFYIKSYQKQYGRLVLGAWAGYVAEIWVNPSGSQNLEFDPKKQIH